MLARRLLGLCGGTGTVRRIAARAAPPLGYYLVEPPAGAGPPLILKVLSAGDGLTQVAADRFARHVAGCGVPASTILPGFPAPLGPDLTAIGYRWLPGRFARATTADAAAIGEVLGRVHLALAGWPDGAAVRQATARRLTQLQAAAARLREGTLAPVEPAGDLPGMLARHACLFGLMAGGPAQVIHGDPNHGNVLFPADGSPPVVLDYEDAGLSWLPPALDVGFAAERFALAAEADDGRAVELARALLGAYASTTGRPIFRWRGAFADILRMLALRSLVQLCLAHAEGAAVAPAEWAKFHFLFGQAETRADLLAALETPHLATPS